MAREVTQVIGNDNNTYDIMDKLLSQANTVTEFPTGSKIVLLDGGTFKLVDLDAFSTSLECKGNTGGNTGGGNTGGGYSDDDDDDDDSGGGSSGPSFGDEIFIGISTGSTATKTIRVEYPEYTMDRMYVVGNLLTDSIVRVGDKIDFTGSTVADALSSIVGKTYTMSYGGETYGKIKVDSYNKSTNSITITKSNTLLKSNGTYSFYAGIGIRYFV